FSSRRRHTRFSRDWSSDVCSSDLFFKLCSISYFTVNNKVAHLVYTVMFLFPLQPFSAFVALVRAGCRVALRLCHLLHMEDSRSRSEERRVGKEWGSREQEVR